MRIAITGATGFIGEAVWRAAEYRGWRVFPYGRRPRAGVYRWNITEKPLADPPSVDAVVHAAASVTDWGSPRPVWQTNVEGTRNVMRSFPTTRVVFLSSASVYDPFTPTVDAREHEAPVNTYLTPYGASKATAERLLANHDRSVILRPHAVYGPGDRTLLPRIAESIRKNTLFMVGDGRVKQSLTSINNVVDATLRACAPDSPTGTYNIADLEPVTVDDALHALLAERGQSVRIRHLPTAPAWALAAAAENAFRCLGRQQPPKLTRYAISHLAYERTLDISAATRSLGYSPAGTDFTGAAHW